jgi:hypothetical protein
LRDFLVFFRAGSNSLHRNILADDPGRNWDCCVSWYCAPPAEQGAEFYVTGGDNKFEAFRNFYLNSPACREYRFVLVADDDIAFAPGDISRYFDHCQRHNLYLSQPALRWGTNSNHDVTLWNPACTIRKVRFIEVMAPCFSQKALVQLIDTFAMSKSTWGIDYAWSSLLRDSGKISVVDAIRVAHTKPVNLIGGAFYQKMKSLGADPEQEYGRIKADYPSFGGHRSERSGHCFRWPLGTTLGSFLTASLEKLKKRVHRFLRLVGKIA